MANLFLLLITLFKAGPAAANSPSVVDAYIDLSKTTGLFTLTDGSKETPAKLKQRIKIKDIKNGYLLINSIGLEAVEAPIQLALFRRKSLTSVVLVAFERGDSTDDLKAFEYRPSAKNKWVEVSEIILPKITPKFLNQRAKSKIPWAKSKDFNLDDCASGTHSYVLPRYGRKVRSIAKSDCLVKGNGTELFQLSLSSGRFTIDP